MAESVETNNFVGSCLKYTLFIFNFLSWIIGLVFLSVGIWAYTEKDKFDVGGAEDIYDVLFDVSIVIIVIGAVVFTVAFAGCLGALRENIIFLKIFSYALGLIFFLELVGGILAFVFSSEVQDMVTETLQDEGLQRYHEKSDFRDLFDWFQEEFKCCGVGELGYQDWSQNLYYNCTTTNPSILRCAVPYSCCKNPDDVNVNLVNRMCGYGTQNLTFIAARETIYTDGCVQKVLDVAEDNMLIIGGIVIGLAIPQLLGVFLSCLMVRDIQDTRDLYNSLIQGSHSSEGGLRV